MCVVCFSGILGVAFYALVPTSMTRNRNNITLDAMLERIAEIDAECRMAADGLPDYYAQAVVTSIDQTHIGGTFRSQLSGRDPDCGTSRALRSLRTSDIDLDGEAKEQERKLIELDRAQGAAAQADPPGRALQGPARPLAARPRALRVRHLRGARHPHLRRVLVPLMRVRLTEIRLRPDRARRSASIATWTSSRCSSAAAPTTTCRSRGSRSRSTRRRCAWRTSVSTSRPRRARR